MNYTRTTRLRRFNLFHVLFLCLTLLSLSLGASTGANAGKDDFAPNLDVCQNLKVPAGNRVAFRLYAIGVQIYRWDGAAWVFQAPQATLFRNPWGHGVIGTHYAGPTWESRGGSKVVGSVLERCTQNPNAIPWLLLKATDNGPGFFYHVTYIQRIHTTGGKAPARPGASMGETVGVPYTAEYVFYRDDCH